MYSFCEINKYLNLLKNQILEKQKENSNYCQHKNKEITYLSQI